LEERRKINEDKKMTELKPSLLEELTEGFIGVSFTIKKAEKSRENAIEFIKSAGNLVVVTALTYMADYSGFVEMFSGRMPESINLTNHLAIGSGLYGGFTNKINAKIISAAALFISMSPELYSAAKGEDIKLPLFHAGLKIASYGLSYGAGYLFRKKIID
jgi:hypothetical protein